MTIIKPLLLLLLAAAAFGGGYLFRARTPREASPAAAPARKVLYYVDPMHPAYTSDQPGIAPDCGMALEPVYADAASSAPAGAIHVPTDRQQLIGLKFATAEWRDGTNTIRTVGTVTYDETRVAVVHPRIEGWIDRVLVNFTGEAVTQGQPLLTIYSPELLASQQELLLARRARDTMARSALPNAVASGEALFEAARRRLELWDLSADQIDGVLATGEPLRSVTLHSPASGFVLKREAFPNQRVTPDSALYTIADLSRVWIMADVFETDIPQMIPGLPARVTFASGASPIQARVAYVQPQVDPLTRTLKVRLEAPNPNIRLKPDMFVDVELTTPGGRRLTVPSGAVLDTGDRQTVFVDLGGGYLAPRPVTIGERTGGHVVITSGLSGGERVVASGTFLIDAESRLRPAAAASAPPASHETHTSAPPASPADSPAPDAPQEHRHD